jgi:hypothetical protein
MEVPRMINVARFSLQDRKDLFIETARKLKMHEGIVEKDFWVCWVLKILFESQRWGRAMVFKGGTSLSKVYKCIKRFSEDIDLIVDWRLLGYTDEDLWKVRSNNQKDKFFKQVLTDTNNFINSTFISHFIGELEEKLEDKITMEFNEPDASVIISYPRAFTNDYISPQIKLEIGPLAEWIPHGTYSITSFAAQEFPRFFSKPHCEVIAICAERTFWEKATILHQQAMRGSVSVRYSRHYYDLAQMAGSNIRATAFERLDLLKDVVSFKMQFYPSQSAHY